MFDRNRLFVPVHQLEIGMFVSDLDRPWLSTPFPIQGFEITSKEEIQQIAEICEYVYIDKKKYGLYDDKPDEDLIVKQNRRLPFKRSYDYPAIKYRKYKLPVDKCVVEEELGNAKDVYEKARRNINKTLECLRSGHEINVKQAKQAVSECVESIFNNKDSLLWFTLIKKRDPYTSEHSLNVTILSIAFGRYLGHSEQVLKTIGLCGLLHDVGKVKIPLEVLNKTGRFTQYEFEIMKQHPEYGYDYLVKQKNVDYEVIHAAYSHHEKMDGSGYPQGLLGPQIPYYAKLIAIIDTYDAITNDRCYKKGRTTLQAQKILYKSAGSHYDEELVKSFIQWLGIYPPASIVEMSNGEVGIVLSANDDWKSKPCVVLLLDEQKQTQPQRIVDLYMNVLDRQGNIYCIKTSHPNNSFGLNLANFQLNEMIMS